MRLGGGALDIAKQLDNAGCRSSHVLLRRPPSSPNPREYITPRDHLGFSDQLYYTQVRESILAWLANGKEDVMPVAALILDSDPVTDNQIAALDTSRSCLRSGGPAILAAFRNRNRTVQSHAAELVASHQIAGAEGPLQDAACIARFQSARRHEGIAYPRRENSRSAPGARPARKKPARHRETLKQVNPPMPNFPRSPGDRGGRRPAAGEARRGAVAGASHHGRRQNHELQDLRGRRDYQCRRTTISTCIDPGRSRRRRRFREKRRAVRARV